METFRRSRYYARTAKILDTAYRSWYYFRTGYSVYLAFIIGFVGNMIVIFKLAIEPIQLSRHYPIINQLFPSLTAFVIIAAAFTIPVGVYIGWFHMKRTGAFGAEASVALESNPYVYKLVPGKEREVFFPLMIMTAKGLSKVLEHDRLLTSDEQRDFEKVLAKAETLLSGDYVGHPRQRRKQEK